MSRTLVRSIAFALLFLLALSPFLGLAAIAGSSEAREAHVLSVIAREGEWGLPTRNGIVPSKPPLYHWIGASLAIATGNTEQPGPFLVRVPSAIFAAAVLFLTLRLCAIFANGVSKRLKVPIQFLVFLNGAILISTYGFTSMAIRSMVDMTFCFFVTLAVFSLLRRVVVNDSGQMSVNLAPRDWTWFYFCCGLAVLAKGPIGIVLPLILTFFGLARIHGFKQSLLLYSRPRISWAIFILIAVPWYLLAVKHGGDAFIERQIFLENIHRFLGQETPKPFHYYIPVLFGHAAPWALVPLCLLFPKIRRAILEDSRTNNLSQIILFWLTTFSAGFLFFSISGGKRLTYLLPLYPYLSLILTFTFGVSFYKLFEAKYRQILKSLRVINLLLALVALIFVGLVSYSGLVSKELLLQAGLQDLRIKLSLIFVALTAILLIVGMRWRKFERHHQFALLFLLFLFQIYAGFQIRQAAIAELKGHHTVAVALNSQISGNEKIYVVKALRDEFFDAMLYALHRKVFLIEPKATEIPSDGYLVTKVSWYSENQPKLEKFRLVETYSRKIGTYQPRYTEDILLLAPFDH